MARAVEQGVGLRARGPGTLRPAGNGFIQPGTFAAAGTSLAFEHAGDLTSRRTVPGKSAWSEGGDIMTVERIHEDGLVEEWAVSQI